MAGSLPLRAGFALLLCSFVFPVCGSAAERAIFVAPQGNDTSDGTEQAPLATLSAAQARVRAWRQAGATDDVHITIAAGDYFLAEPVKFTADDAAPGDAMLLITAAPGARVRFFGGERVTDWQPLTDAKIRARLSPEAARHVRVAQLSERALAGCGEHCARGHEHEWHPSPLEVFYKDEPATLARWPNQGWAHVGQVISQGSASDGSTSQFRMTACPARPWQATDDLWAHGFWEADWSDAWQPIAAVDTARGLLTLRNSDEVTTIRPDARYCVYNVLEELNAPGEWYLDRAAGKLYLWPAGDLTDHDVVVSALDHLISIYDCSHVTLQNLEFSAAKVCAVEIARGHHVRIDHCDIRNAGNLGVHIVAGHHHAVARCEICQTGEGAIRVSGGDRQTLTPSHHAIEGNHLHHFARSCFAARPAVLVDGVGIRVANNHIHHGPDSAVTLQGNEHVVEHNDIHAVCLETADTGAIYLGHDWTERGNAIRHNFIHHIGQFNRRDVMGVYLDDFASGTTVTHNYFLDAGRAVVIGGGRDNRVEYNIIVGGVAGVQVDSRGLTWARDRIDGDEALLPRLLANVCTEGSACQARYPELARLLQDEPAVAKGNRLAHNLILCPIAIDLQGRPTHRGVVVAGNLATGQSQLGHHPDQNLLSLWQRLAGTAP
jgi:hypothetical protein